MSIKSCINIHFSAYRTKGDIMKYTILLVIIFIALAVNIMIASKPGEADGICDYNNANETN